MSIDLANTITVLKFIINNSQVRTQNCHYDRMYIGVSVFFFFFFFFFGGGGGGVRKFVLFMIANTGIHVKLNNIQRIPMWKAPESVDVLDGVPTLHYTTCI